VLPPPGTRLAAVRRRPPPARHPAPWAEFLRHFRAQGGRPTLLDLFPSSLAAVLNLAGGMLPPAGRARVLCSGASAARESGLTAMPDRLDQSNRFTIQSCVLKLPKFVEKS